MNLHTKRWGLILAWTLAALLCFPVLLPHWRLMFFGPFLVILYYQKSFLTCLWTAAACGLLLDLLSSHSHLGLWASNYCLVTALLYPQQRHFFADRISTLPLMTFFFSFLSTFIQGGFFYVFEHEEIFSLSWVVTDLIVMPASDALYAFLCFIFPYFCFGKPQRRGKDYFLERQ